MNTVAFPIIALISAVVIAAFLMVYLGLIAKRVGLTDEPNSRKRHKRAIPVIGGISIILAFFLALLLLPGTLSGHRILFFSIGVLGIVGVIDDHSEIPSAAKFLAQVLVASLIATVGEMSLSNIGDIFNSGETQGLNIFGSIFTIIAIVGVINAFNMIDGLDGLAGCLALLPLLYLTHFFFVAGDYDSYHLLLICSAIVISFLFFNIPGLLPSRLQVFMGDTGSMFLGLLIVYFLLKAAIGSDSANLAPPVAPWLIAIPLLDMVAVIYLRIAQRRSPFKADRAHLHDALGESKFSDKQALFIILVPAVTFALIGTVAHFQDWPDWVTFWLFVVLVPISIGVKLLLFKTVSKKTELST